MGLLNWLFGSSKKHQEPKQSVRITISPPSHSPPVAPKSEIANVAPKSEVAKAIIDQTGNPAFMHETNWAVASAKKDYRTAVEELNKALSVLPDDPRYLALRGMTFYLMADYRAANSDLRAALKRNPSQEEALGMLRSMRSDALKLCDQAKDMEGNMGEGLRLLDRALEICPDEASILFFRTMHHHQMYGDDIDLITRNLRRVIQLDPQHADAKHLLQVLLQGE